MVIRGHYGGRGNAQAAATAMVYPCAKITKNDEAPYYGKYMPFPYLTDDLFTYYTPGDINIIPRNTRMDTFLQDLINKTNALKKSGFGIFLEKVTRQFQLKTGIRYNNLMLSTIQNMWMVNVLQISTFI